MAEHQDILFGQSGQVLYYDCPEGRPSTVTSVEVFAAYNGDDTLAESATTGNPVIDSTFVIVDADSGRDQADSTKIWLNDTSDVVVGRTYQLTNNEASEWVEVVSIDEGNAVFSRFPLANNYVAGNRFQGTRITISVDTTWVSDSTNISADSDPNPGYRVRWVYTVDGSKYVHYTTFDLVRYIAGHNVTPQDVDAVHPGWMNTLPTGHKDDQGARLINAAYDQVVIDLHQAGVPDEQVRHQDILDDLVIKKTIVLWMQHRFANQQAFSESVDYARDEYQKRLDSLIRLPGETKIPVGTGTSGAADTVATPKLTVR